LIYVANFALITIDPRTYQNEPLPAVIGMCVPLDGYDNDFEPMSLSSFTSKLPNTRSFEAMAADISVPTDDYQAAVEPTTMALSAVVA
jgi:hypothetical protein